MGIGMIGFYEVVVHVLCDFVVILMSRFWSAYMYTCICTCILPLSSYCSYMYSGPVVEG